MATNKRAMCEWCGVAGGDYDLSPPNVDYATMICEQCYAQLHREIMEQKKGEKEE